MRYSAMMSRLAVSAAGLWLFAGLLSAGEKKLMHCFYYTPQEGATQADWEAFYKATDELPGKIPGLSKVWYGKLRQNLTVYAPDRETSKKLRAGEKSVTGQISQRVRQYGVCMEMDNEAALKTYADHPAHKEWEKVYFKVREYGTTTVDLLGQ